VRGAGAGAGRGRCRLHREYDKNKSIDMGVLRTEYCRRLMGGGRWAVGGGRG
jgi:hypothetical protein